MFFICRRKISLKSVHAYSHLLKQRITLNGRVDVTISTEWSIGFSVRIAIVVEFIVLYPLVTPSVCTYQIPVLSIEGSLNCLLFRFSSIEVLDFSSPKWRRKFILKQATEIWDSASIDWHSLNGKECNKKNAKSSKINVGHDGWKHMLPVCSLSLNKKGTTQVVSSCALISAKQLEC